MLLFIIMIRLVIMVMSDMLVFIFNRNCFMIFVVNFNFTILPDMFMVTMTMASLTFLLSFFLEPFGILMFGLVDDPESLFELCALLCNFLMDFLFVILIEYFFNVFVQLHFDEICPHFFHAADLDCHWFFTILKLNLFLAVVDDAFYVEERSEGFVVLVMLVFCSLARLSHFI